MKITALVENESSCELKAKHGLSLYIETKHHRILFDLGPNQTLFQNAKKKKIDLTTVDIVIISHGHTDHGGALCKFLNINKKARIYIQKDAFLPHYTKTFFLKFPVGLDQTLMTHPQVTLVEGDYNIDEELSLFTVTDTKRCRSPFNDVLYEKKKKDSFSHEQNLIIKEAQTVLIMGCGHAGVVNIMHRAECYHPQVCIGGFHLTNPVTKRSASHVLLDEIARELKCFEQVKFYTCHCTGKKAYQYLSQQMPNLFYLSCGESLDLL